jgi:hypothetical protein
VVGLSLTINTFGEDPNFSGMFDLYKLKVEIVISMMIPRLAKIIIAFLFCWKNRENIAVHPSACFIHCSIFLTKT